MAICSGCKHWQRPEQRGKSGSCHLKAPTTQGFPQCGPKDWCSEHEEGTPVDGGLGDILP